MFGECFPDLGGFGGGNFYVNSLLEPVVKFGRGKNCIQICSVAYFPVFCVCFGGLFLICCGSRACTFS